MLYSVLRLRVCNEGRGIVNSHCHFAPNLNVTIAPRRNIIRHGRARGRGCQCGRTCINRYVRGGACVRDRGCCRPINAAIDLFESLRSVSGDSQACEANQRNRCLYAICTGPDLAPATFRCCVELQTLAVHILKAELLASIKRGNPRLHCVVRRSIVVGIGSTASPINAAINLLEARRSICRLSKAVDEPEALEVSCFSRGLNALGSDPDLTTPTVYGCRKLNPDAALSKLAESLAIFNDTNLAMLLKIARCIVLNVFATACSVHATIDCLEDGRRQRGRTRGGCRRGVELGQRQSAVDI
mmetsp:Transcript_21324/g.45391  ORF Transcript_21324/g.45391 Transcript_21324/m.45391 type:complete len:300 (+) Transcript_21324:584-1483(+)